MRPYFILSAVLLCLATQTLGAVNLIVNSGVVPTSMNRGGTYSLSITVRNTGTTATATSFPINVSINSTSTYGGHTYLADLWVNGGIGAMQNKTVTGNITIPCTYPTGSKFILTSVDPTNIIAESSNTDNDLPFGVLIQATAVDLVPLNYSVSPSTITAGQNVTATFAVNNTGGSSTGSSFSVGFYLSATTTLNVGQADNLGSQSVSSLSGCSQSVPFNKSLTIPSDKCTNTYYLFIWVDNGQVIPEGTNDNNNFQYQAIQVNGISPSAPVALLPLSSTITATSFTARWSSVPSSTYRLDVADNPGFSPVLPGYNNLSVGSATSHSVTGLTCNEDYHYRVRAYNGCAYSTYSNEIQVDTDPGTPSAPASISISNASATSLVANWTQAISATGYSIDVSLSPNFSSFVPGYQSLPVGDVLSKTVTGLACCTTYYVRVRASNPCGLGPYSDDQSASTSACSCSFDLSLSNVSVPFLGVNSQVNVETDQCCSWSAHCAATWVELAADVASGVLYIDVQTNTEPFARSATISVEGETIGINQAANPVPASIHSPLPSVAQYSGVLQSVLPFALYSFSIGEQCLGNQFTCSSVFFQTPYASAPTIANGKTANEYIPRATDCFSAAQLENRWEFRQRGFITENLGIMCNTIACPLNQSTVSHSANGCGQKDDRYAWDVNLATDACDAHISVYAVEDGIVDQAAGSHVRIRHTTPDGEWYSYYDNIDIAPGLPVGVQLGQEIGVIKKTTAYPPHLHFGVYYRSAEPEDSPIVSVNRLIEPEYVNPLTQEAYALGSLEGVCSGSILSAANIFVQRSGRWNWAGITDENGRFKLTVIPALAEGDSIKVVASGYETLAIALGLSDIQGQRMSIPMLPSAANTTVRNARVAVLENAPYFSTSSVELGISGEGYTYYDVVRIYYTEDSLVSVPLSLNHPISEHTVGINLPDTGMNVVGVYFRGIDTVLVTQQLEYLPGSPNYPLEIQSDNSVLHAEVYVNDRFVKRINGATETFSLSNRGHFIHVTKPGYRDTTFTVDSAAVVNLTLLAQPTGVGVSCDSTVINFLTEGKIQHRKGVTVMDSAQASVITFKRCYDELQGLGIVPNSERFDLRRLSISWSPLRFAAALDQAEVLSPDSVYLLTIRDDTTFQKDLFTEAGNLIAFDSLSQKLSCRHLGNSSASILKESVVIAKRKAPVPTGVLNIEVALGGTLSLPLANFFMDPDSLEDDMLVTVEATESGLTATITGDTITIGASGIPGQLDLTIRAVHDGLERLAILDVLVVVPSVAVSPRAMLDGALNLAAGLLSDSLRVKGLIPLTEPYTGLGYSHQGGGGGEATSGTALAVTGPNAVVDWVVIELRDVGDPAHVVQSRSALLQRDGDITGADGTSAVVFSVIPGFYHVAIRHRNHLGTMTADAVALSSTITLVDFTSSALATYGSDARKSSAGMMALWAGNTLWDSKLAYVGAANDRDPILVRIGGSVPTNTTPGYYREDVTLDGIVKYVGSSNDRDPILVNIGGSVPTNTRIEQLP
jgi:hypothetical protein